MDAAVTDGGTGASGRVWPKAAAPNSNNPANHCLEETGLGMFPPSMHVMHHRVDSRKYLQQKHQ
jgi:hypothetical protein